jgi:Ca-activated chloride channel family protein
VNTHLLDRIAGETRAASQYVAPEEDLEVKLSGFFGKISEPVLSNLSIEFASRDMRGSQMHPNSLPDLFNGEALVVFGRYTGDGATAVEISGMMNGKQREFADDVNFAAVNTDNPFIPRLWATRRVGWLLDEIRLRGETAELRDEVTKLARDFGIVTPYTAYLVMEDESRRNVPAEMRNFRELESDRAAQSRAREALSSIRAEAGDEKQRSGVSAVQNAVALQQMQYSRNAQDAAGLQAGLDKAGASASRLAGYKVSQNYAQQARAVNGRAFYQNGRQWTDSTAQYRQALKQKVVAFNSDDYFELLRKHPEANPWFALGSEVDVVIGDVLYQVREI